MISVVLLFGPNHGQIMYLKDRPKEQIMVPSLSEPRAMFQEYRFGEPYGDPRPSMMNRTHVYEFHDALENGVEEVAIYIHAEKCCDEGYEKSEHYKQNQPLTPDERPHMGPSVRKLRGDIW